MENNKINTFKDYKPVRISQELYAFEKYRFKLSVHGYRLLYAIAQSLDYHQKELFPEYGFDIQAIFKYLAIENSGRRYEFLKEALDNISDNWLTYKTIKKNGGIRWDGIAWITRYSFATDEALLSIRINEDVKPFLLNLKQYALIRPKDYLSLTTEYQNWFYPYLKNVVKLGRWRASIEDLKHALFLEKTSSYDPKQNKNAISYFLDRVIGIQLSEKAKLENQSAKAAKRNARLIEWDFVKDKDGKETGTLYGITSGTDLNVTASVEKTGRSYTHIIFFVSEKTKKAKAIQEIEEDFGKAQERGKRTRKTQQIGNLFKPELMPETVPTARVQYYTTEQIKYIAKDHDTTSAFIIDKMRLKPNGDGRYYKEY